MNIFGLPIENGIPFSFKYGGKPSQSLLPAWGRSGAKCYQPYNEYRWWDDTDTGLRVSVHAVKYDTGIVEWVLSFTNKGTEPTPIIEEVWAAWTVIPGRLGWAKGIKVHRLNGSVCQENDWLPYTTEMPPGSLLKFAPTDGRSSNGACPFFNVEWNGGGVITAIGWTGQWHAEVAWGTKTEIRVGQERLHLSLNPGESIRSPSILQLYWQGDIEDSYNRFRQVMFEHVLPRRRGEVVIAPVAHLTTAAYEWNWSTEKDVLSHLDVTRELGFETFWLDAYYMDNFPSSMGDLGPEVDSIVNMDRFPRGLGYIGDRAHEAGMEWLVWHTFEAVAPGTWLDRERPEWLLSTEGREYKLLNLGLPEVQEYMIEYFVKRVQDSRLDWLRIDCCPATKPYWQEADPVDRVGITEIRWIEGLYRILDTVLSRCPDLKIDNCDGGGRRIDLEMCKRTTPLWRTDYSTPVIEHGDYDTGAMLTQTMIAGLTRYVPFNSCGGFSPEPYYVRSGFNGGIGFLQDCRGEFFPRDRMKAAIEEAKRIRKYLFGDLYLLTPVTLDPTTWHVFQYHRPDERDGMVMALRRHECPDVWFACDLRGIDPRGIYDVMWYNDYSLKETLTLPGPELKKLHLYSYDCPGSLLIEYRKVNGHRALRNSAE